MKKKNIFSGKYESFTEDDFPILREHFLNVFMKGTYKKRSLYETRGYGMFGTYGNGTEPLAKQPRVRGRFLAEENYKGKYQPGAFIRCEAVSKPSHFMVIGRYYTKNLGWKHLKVRALVLSGSDKGKVISINIGVA